jgi:nitrogen fixation NifU-like protein
MADNRALYEQVILDHNKSPRNFGKMEHPDREAEGYNALCGDQLHVYLKMDGDRIDDVKFEGAGCAISKSSASVMTTAIQGKTRDEVEALFNDFKGMITSEPGTPIDAKAMGKLAIFSGVREFPVRVKCATLAWHTALSALRGGGEEAPVSTE